MEDNEFQERLNFVLSKLRSRDTRDNALLILQILNDIAPDWVRTKELREALPIEYDPQYFRLMKTLTTEGIVETRIDTESREPGKKPVYYRLPEKYPPRYFETDMDRVVARYKQLDAAKEILKDMGLDPDKAISDKMRELEGDVEIPPRQDTIPAADVQKAVTPSHSMKYRAADGSIWEMYTRPDGKKDKRLIKSAPATKPQAEIEGHKKKARKRI